MWKWYPKYTTSAFVQNYDRIQSATFSIPISSYQLYSSDISLSPMATRCPFPFNIGVTMEKPQPKAKILIVEDENIIARDIQTTLQSFGYEVFVIVASDDGAAQRAAEIKPDLVLMPSRNDLHQDHFTIATEGLRAFKFTSILAYEISVKDRSQLKAGTQRP